TPIVTSGMTHGFSIIADLFVNGGDLMVLPDKFWGNYLSIYGRKHEAEIVTYPFFDSRWQFNTRGLAETLIQAGERCRKLIVILNFPHNPTGYAINSAEAWQTTQAIKQLAEQGNQLLVMVDDAYFGMWYDDNVLRESLFGWLTDLHPNVIPVKIDGATKEEYSWGLRVGFLTFGLNEDEMKPLEEKITALIRVSTSGTSQLSQTMVYQTMNTPEYTEEKQEKYETLKSRALKVKDVVRSPTYEDLWEVYPFHAGYFMCLRLKRGNAEAVRQHLLNEYGIGVVSQGDSELRVAYSCVDESDIQFLFDAIAEATQAQ
ncbi:MAG: aminotransferase class I/II-fold pyridoxal phosphate-dependent enzyme, partial [Candidatus Poribacteria bacterium]|nr:aminotransferase class I/II-fold pyridoxal phosphate-dependent enzyme [Candidatus Poribacteria bacterium]